MATDRVTEPAVPTLGVEEEFHLVDPATRMLVPRSVELLQSSDDERLEAELRRFMVETRTDVCSGLDDVRTQLLRLRQELLEAADGVGCRLLATGTAPLGRVHDQPTSPGSRYARMTALHRELVLSAGVCGIHVHVGVADRDLAVALLPHVRPWLPVLRAMSASSPYFEGHDTGYASFRSIVWRQWPTAGEPETFSSAAEYDQVVDDLVASGAILDAGQIYWDVRLSAAHPTLEFRIADANPRIDEVVLIAGLCRALVMTAIATHRAGRRPPDPRPELVRAATWYAARYGLDVDLLDLGASRRVPAREQVTALLTALRPALEEAEDWPQVRELLDGLLARGNAARRLREVHRRSGDLRSVVDAAVADTAGRSPDGDRPAGGSP